MNVKRLTAILISVAFFLVVVFSLVALFSIKKVEVEYVVAEETDTSEIQDSLNGYLGKSLVCLKTDSVYDAVKDFYYMEVVSVEKSYPNVLKVRIQERRETYYLEHNDKVYVATADGFILNIVDKDQMSNDIGRDKIALKVTVNDSENQQISYANLLGLQRGQTVSIDGDGFLKEVFEMAKSVNLADCIKEINVETAVNGTIVVNKDVVITTHTGVKIRIMDAGVLGAEKITKVFEGYDELSDFEKQFGYLKVGIYDDSVPEVGGQIFIEWDEKDFF